jgi:hypothetical protein
MGADWDWYWDVLSVSCVFAPAILPGGRPYTALLRRATRAFFRTEILFYIGSPK